MKNFREKLAKELCHRFTVRAPDPVWWDRSAYIRDTYRAEADKLIAYLEAEGWQRPQVGANEKPSEECIRKFETDFHQQMERWRQTRDKG